MKNELIILCMQLRAFLKGKESGYCRWCNEYVIYESEEGDFASSCEDCLN